MKTVAKNVTVVALALCGVLIQPAMSQLTLSETTLGLQSKISSQALGGASTLNISFG